MPSNIDTPASTIGGGSLSPSNESRFVPRSSLYASPTSASKQHEDAGDNNGNPPNLIDDDKSLVVGATICFTPEASPRNTPLKGTKRSALDLSPLESALSSNATDEYIGSIIDGNKVSSSNVILTTSSLDGKSTTEYEILDKSLEIEDLNLGEEEEDDDTNEDNGGAGKKKAKNIDGDVADLLENMSPTSSLPSLDSKDGEDGVVDEDTKQVPVELDDGASTTSSSKVDDRPLTPFNNLHKFWEGQSIANVSKSIMGRILSQETVPDPTADHTRLERDEVHTTPSKKITCAATNKVNGSLFGVASNRVIYYVASIFVMAGLMAHRFASSSLHAVKYCSQIMLRKDTNAPVHSSASTKAPEETGEHPAAEAPVATPSKSKLFLDEKVPQSESKLGSMEDDKDASEDVTAEPLDMKELERLRKINSWALHLAAAISTMTTTIMNFASTRGGQFFLSFLVAFLVMTELRMLQRYNISPKDVVAWDNLLCVDTGTAVIDSIPLWEYILSPTSFGTTASEPIDYKGLIFAGVTILASAIFAYWNIPYNSGYWNEKEHHQFLKGYKENGKDWEAVTKFVPTRSLQQVKNHGNYWLSIRSPGKAHPFSPKGIKVVKKERFVSPRNNTDMTDPCRRAKVRHTPLSDPVKRAKMRLLDKGGQDTSEE